jgi:glycosyltransferase involved in cell wall biosynthesis
MPRYRWGKLIAPHFDKILFRALKKTNVILACADQLAIEQLVKRSQGVLNREEIIQFPTRVDIDLFRPFDKQLAKNMIGVTEDIPLIISCGRINRVKGWRLLVEGFRYFLHQGNKGKLIFVGDGEDRSRLEGLIREYDLEKAILISGFKPPKIVSYYLNAADLVIFGSHREGWSIAMIEALACGKPIVSTVVSGTRKLIHDGVNGCIVAKKDPVQFAQAINKALQLPDPARVSVKIAKRYSLRTLKDDLGTVWEPLR